MVEYMEKAKKMTNDDLFHEFLGKHADINNEGSNNVDYFRYNECSKELFQRLKENKFVSKEFEHWE